MAFLSAAAIFNHPQVQQYLRGLYQQHQQGQGGDGGGGVVGGVGGTGFFPPMGGHVMPQPQPQPNPVQPGGGGMNFAGDAQPRAGQPQQPIAPGMGMQQPQQQQVPHPIFNHPMFRAMFGNAGMMQR